MRPDRWQRHYRTYRGIFFITLFALVVLMVLANRQEERRKREEGSFVRSEQLTRDDHPFSAGSTPFDAWTVDLIAGQTLRAEIRTSEFVPYIFVMGPMADESPPVVAKSTEMSTGRATLEFAPSRAGEYAVVVPSVGDALGAYQLTTNYRATALGSTDRRVEGAIEVVGIAVMIFWFAQYLGLFTFLGWRDPDRILLNDCQVIVVDATDAGGGTRWEIEELFRRGYVYKCVFLVRDHADEATAARTMLEQVAGSPGLTESQMPVLHRYADDGRLVDPDAFDEAYAAAVSNPQQSSDTPLPISRKAVLAVTPILGPFWAPVAIPLAILAIRDIRRVNGLMRGEMLAHMAIVLYGVLFAGMVLIFVTR